MSQDRYAAIHRDFRWQVPEQFNIAEHCCARWARLTPGKVAIRCVDELGAAVEHSYGELQAQANRLANALFELGVQRGDRVAIVMPQCFETAVAHMAIYKLGAIAVPLSILFGPDALEYRLRDAGVSVAITDAGGIANVMAARLTTPALQTVIGVGGAEGRGALDWSALLAAQSVS